MSLAGTGSPEHDQTRILVHVATRRDAEVTVRLLRGADLDATVCTSLAEVIEEIPRGAGALLLTEEALASDHAGRLLRILQNQEAWSDLPIVVLVKGGNEPHLPTEVLRRLTNVTLLERPVPIRSLLSAIEAAARERRRQYQIRDQLVAVQQAEARAQKLQQQLESALEGSDVGTFYVDLPPRELECDDRCASHLGLPCGGVVAFADALRRVHPEDRAGVSIAARSVVSGQQFLAHEFRINADHTAPRRWIRIQGRVMRVATSGTSRFVGTTQDATPRRQMEEERAHLLRQEQNARAEAERANRLKDEFLATLSHELRTPLNAIAGWVELLKQEPDDLPLVAEAASAIERSVRVQAELIEDLLDVSRIISGKVRLELRPVWLPDVVAAAIDTVRPAAQNKRVSLETRAEPRLPRITGDPARLQQIIWNLLSNAVKFTPPGGAVRVGLRRHEDAVVITVADTGEGVSAEFLPRLFERFSQADSSSTRRHGGLGLGLSIVKGLTELHGGRVSVASPGPQQGTTFTIELPMRTPAAEKVVIDDDGGTTAPTIEPVTADLTGIRVLIVDDEPEGREVLRRLLTACGATVFAAASVPEAHGLVVAERPQVIVSDIGMPGTDGYQFVRDLRRQRIAIPAIALTAFARSEDANRARAVGYQAHLPKPIQPAKLLRHVARLAVEAPVA